MEIVTSWMERGLQQGRQEGRQEGLGHERKLALRLLRKRLGDLTAPVEAQIESLSADRLEQLGEALLDFSSLADLDAWLQTQR
jgi:predicted transposase YdaD